MPNKTITQSFEDYGVTYDDSFAKGFDEILLIKPKPKSKPKNILFGGALTLSIKRRANRVKMPVFNFKKETE